MAKPLQAAFTAGELSPGLYARTDLTAYAHGLKTCRNFFVRYTGGVSNRPGTQFVAAVKDSAAETVLIPFRFSRTTSYVLEFGNQYLRVVKAGAQALDGAAPYEIETPYTTADLADLRFTQSADVMFLVHPNHPPYKLSRTGDTAWSLAPFIPTDGPFQDINADDSIVVWASGDTGSVTLSASGDIFTTKHVGALFYLEAQNLNGIAPWEPDKQIAAPGANPNGQIRRNSLGDVYKCVTDVTAGTEEIRTGTVEPTHKSGIASDGDGSPITQGSSTTLAERAGVAWQYLYSFYGRLKITGFTDARHVTAYVLGRLPGQATSTTTGQSVLSATGDGSTKTFATSGATSDTSSDYIVTLKHTEVYDEFGNKTFPVTTTTLSPDQYTVDSTAQTLTFDTAPPNGDAIEATETGTGSPAEGVTPIWALGAWSKESGYPETVAFFADRLVFGGNAAQPQTVWTTKTGNYASFDVSFPIQADDAITFTLNAREINPINELLPLPYLVMLTQGAEWRMTAGANELVTPTTVGARLQSGYGARNIRAEVIGNRAVYAESQGGRVRGMAFNAQAAGYISDDLCIQADHLFDGHTLKQLAYHRAPYRMLWAVRDDGVLLSLTYVPEQQVLAWARHDTAGTFEQAVVVPEGEEDALYVIVKRTVNGATKRYIERLHSRQFSDDCHDAWFVDAGLAYDGEPVTTVSGLEHLEGCTVAVLNDGNVETQKTVSNGAITLDNAGSHVIVGLPFNADIETLNVNFAGAETLTDRLKSIPKVSLIVRDTRGLVAGETPTSELYGTPARELENWGEPAALKTDTREIPIEHTWNLAGRVFVRQPDPLPATILGIVPTVVTGGSRV